MCLRILIPRARVCVCVCVFVCVRMSTGPRLFYQFVPLHSGFNKSGMLVLQRRWESGCGFTTWGH